MLQIALNQVLSVATDELPVKAITVDLQMLCSK